jgi:O-antigen/teichoic acid export membrane protein
MVFKVSLRRHLAYVYAFLGEATLGLTFLLYIILARVLGPEQYELFAAAAALGGILSFIIQFGLPTLLGREVAAHPEEGPKSTLACLLLEAFIAIPVFLLLFPLAQALGYTGSGLVICYLVILAEVGRSAKLTLRGVLRGLNQFGAEAASVTLERLLAVLLTWGVMVWNHSLIWAVATLALVRLGDILGLVVYLSQRTQIIKALSLGYLWELLRRASPFALAGVLWILYYQVDIVMLKAIAPAGEAGYYSAAYRVMEIFSALPRVIFYVAFTKFAHYHASEPERLPQEIYRSTRLLLVAVLPVLLIAGFLQTSLIQVLYGAAYLPSVSSLAVLLPSVSMQMFGAVGNQFLQATGRERLLPPILIGTVLLNITANFILIPRLGATGAALATLLSALVLTFLSLSQMMAAGHRQAGRQLYLIVMVSLGMAMLPFLALKGLPPGLALGSIVPAIAVLCFLMNQQHFLPESSSN